MENELKDLKSVLRSIVVSSPAQVDVRSLQRDYKNMMGVPIPLAKFGYRDVLVFLKERCSDCFLFQGLPSNPVLTLIVPDTLKHIDQFVQKQKPSAITKMKGKRRSVNEIHSSKPNLISQTFNRNHVSAQCLNNIQPKVKPPDIKNNQINKSSTIPTDTKYNSARELTDNTKPAPNLKPDKENVNSHSHIENNGCNDSVCNILKKRLLMYDSSQYLDSEECYEPDKTSSKEDNDSGRQTSSSQSSTKRAQFEELKCEIHELIKEHEDGILCTDLMRLYRERYSRELNFNRFGHNNINSVLSAMEDRVAFYSSGAGVRVRDGARAPAPAPAPPRARLAPRPMSLRALPVDPDDALPGIDFDPDVFPADCMHFMESIPALALHDVCAGAMLEVAVGEVYSPSHFWLQRLGPHHNLAMNELMDEMTAYYGSEPGRERVLSRGAVRPGHYCSSVYDRDWHRSLIIKIVDADTVKVRHVDYGTVDTVHVATLKPLLRRWGQLPAQALRARLAGLRPGAGGRRWPHAAAAHFLNLVRDKNFIANVVAIDPEEDTIETFLIDTSGADDVCVTSELIRAGHADGRADSALRTGECYLYPRFEALESGATPNFAEIHRYLADGINLEYVEAYRRHVPTALPAPAPAAPAPPAVPAAPESPAFVPAPPPAARLPHPLELLNRVSQINLNSLPCDEAAPASPALSVPSPVPTSPEPPSSPPSPPPTSPVTSPAPAPFTASPPPASLGVSPSPPHLTPAPPAVEPCTPVTAPQCSPVVTPQQSSVTTPQRSSVNAPQRSSVTGGHSAQCFPVVASQRFPTDGSAPMQPWRATTSFPAATPWGEVRLTLQECNMYSLLSSLDPEAAHCYMLSALRRAAAAAAAAPGPRPPTPTVLNPLAPEFRACYPPQYAYGRPAAPPPRFGPPSYPFMRPPQAPPGF